MHLKTTSGINSSFPELSPSLGQVAYVLRTRSPLSHPRIATLLFSLDLHVLTTPPAFTLSQNQTLRKIYLKILLREVQLLVFYILTMIRWTFFKSNNFRMINIRQNVNLWFAQSYLVNIFQRTTAFYVTLTPSPKRILC